jgi:katanin p80 WD40 repeat-containing subunit B1
MILNSQNINNINQIEVSSLEFNYSEDEAFSGSNRGMINKWDLSSTKISCTLKGHSLAVNCLGRFKEERAKHLLVSGS